VLLAADLSRRLFDLVQRRTGLPATAVVAHAAVAVIDEEAHNNEGAVTFEVLQAIRGRRVGLHQAHVEPARGLVCVASPPPASSISDLRIGTLSVAHSPAQGDCGLARPA